MVRVALTVPGISPYVRAVGRRRARQSAHLEPQHRHTSTDSHFMVQLVAGIMFGAGIWNGFAEADYRCVQISGASDNDFVFRAGFIWRFGK
jgi:hypothetical protein